MQALRERRLGAVRLSSGPDDRPIRRRSPHCSQIWSPNAGWICSTGGIGARAARTGDHAGVDLSDARLRATIDQWLVRCWPASAVWMPLIPAS
nr:hypothetical protein [Sphingomonas changnyeongensis]